MPVVLADLVPLVVFGVALALTLMCIALTKALFGVSGTVLGKLPVVGGWIDATGHHIEQRITNVLGGVALKLEAGIGATWHGTARLVDWIGHEIASHAAQLATLAQLATGHIPIATLYHDFLRARRLLHSLVGRIEGIGHDVVIRTRSIERGIGEDVLPRIRGLEREVNGEIVRERVRARAAERTAAREITNLWKWTRTHALRAGSLAFAGAVALALARLGLGWLRCNSLSRLGRKIGCGGFGAADELLFGAVTALAVTDLCDFADVAYGIAEQLTPVLIELVDVEQALVGCHGATAPPLLELPRAYLPPVPDPLPLAA